MKTFLRILFPVLALAVFPGCASKTDEQASKDKEDDRDQYIYVDSGLGSRIPRRIKIDDLSRATVKGAHPTARITGEEIRDMLAHPFPVSRGVGGGGP